MKTLGIFFATAMVWMVGATAAEAAGDGGYHPHHVAVFVGGTDSAHEGSGVSLGIDYEYRWHQNFGVGVLAEYADLNHAAWIVGVPLFVHPYRGLKLLVMPGVEFTNNHSNFLTRVGVGYDFHIGDWSITPSANVDFVAGANNLVFGLGVMDQSPM